MVAYVRLRGFNALNWGGVNRKKKEKCDKSNGDFYSTLSWDKKPNESSPAVDTAVLQVFQVFCPLRAPNKLEYLLFFALWL